MVEEKNNCVSLLLIRQSAHCLSDNDSAYEQQQNPSAIYFKTNNRIILLKDGETSVLFNLETCRHNKTVFWEKISCSLSTSFPEPFPLLGAGAPRPQAREKVLGTRLAHYTTTLRGLLREPYLGLSQKNKPSFSWSINCPRSHSQQTI